MTATNQVPFLFTGKPDKPTIDLGGTAITPEALG
jgi:hypothetical protein